MTEWVRDFIDKGEDCNTDQKLSSFWVAYDLVGFERD